MGRVSGAVNGFFVGVGLSPQEGKRPVHARGLLCELWLFQREVADTLDQRHQGGDVGEAQHDVDDAPAPCAGVELVDADAAQQQGQNACGNFAFLWWQLCVRW